VKTANAKTSDIIKHDQRKDDNLTTKLT